jgi:hypothetical protein
MRAEENDMNARQAIEFVKRHGVVLEAGTGPVPSLVEVITGGPVRGSWWAHPRRQEIFELTRAVRDSEDVLVCRIVSGKVTYVHRRLWASLVRVSKRFPPKRLAWIHEEHTATGRHVTREVPYPKWVPRLVSAEATGLSEEAAVRELGDWCS